MDLTTFAHNIVLWVAPALPLLASEAGKEIAKQGVKDVWEFIKVNLKTRGEEKAVVRFETTPANPDTQVAIRLALQEAMEQDPKFLDWLKKTMPNEVQRATQSVTNSVGVILVQGHDNSSRVNVSGDPVIVPKQQE